METPPGAEQQPRRSESPAGDATLEADTLDGVRRRDATETGVRAVGRFALLRPLGQGGMGTVYAGYDERLDRKVAVKLLRRKDATASARLLREAQAMARIDHPNVIKVYEAGESAGQLYIAMEFIDGEDLGRWQQHKRTWHEIVEVYTQAGRGLAAAHGSRLVHRDFKPHNVMIDREVPARVRVLDFGLAGRGAETTHDDDRDASPSGDDPLATPLTNVGAVMGTPAYMAPEQIGGRPATHLTDQFSYCVALWEALYGARPFVADSIPALANVLLEGKPQQPVSRGAVPSWLHAMLLRGLDPDPERRWPDMNALLSALDRGRRRSRRIAVGLGITVAAIGVVALAVDHDPDVCLEADEALAAVWTPSRADELQRALAEVEVASAATTASHTVELLDAYGDAWVVARRDACEAALVRREQSTALMLDRTRCLDGRLRSFAALVDVLATPDRETLEFAPRAATELPAIDVCADAEYVATAVPLPEDPDVARRVEEIREALAHAHALRESGDYAAAATLVEPLATEADTLGYPPLVVEANDELAEARFSLAQYDRARTAAYAAYVQSSHATIESRAANDRLLSRLARKRGDLAEARAHAEKAVFVVEAELGPDHPETASNLEQLARAVLELGELELGLELAHRVLNAREASFGPEHPSVASAHDLLASAYGDAGRHREAEAEIRRALEIMIAVRGPDHPDVAGELHDLGYALHSTGAFAESLEAHQRAAQMFAAALGPDHPNVGQAREGIASALGALGRFAEALEERRVVLPLLEAALGPMHPTVAIVHTGIGIDLDELGKPREALASFRRALEIELAVYGPDHVAVAASRSNIGSMLGRLGDFEGALLEHRRALASEEASLGPSHLKVASSLNSIGSVLGHQGRHEEALEQLRHALQIRVDALGPDHPTVATSRNNVAVVLSDLGRTAEAIAEYELVLAIRERALGPEHPLVAATYGNIGSALGDAGDSAGAILQHEKALAIDLASFGPEHPTVALRYHNRAAERMELGELEAATEDFRHAIGIYAAVYGPDHHEVTSSRRALAYCLLQRDRPTEALAELRRIGASIEVAPSPEVVDDASTLAMLAILHARHGTRGEVDTALARLDDLARAHSDDDAVAAAGVVARALIGRRRLPAEAIAVLRARGLKRFVIAVERSADAR